MRLIKVLATTIGVASIVAGLGIWAMAAEPSKVLLLEDFENPGLTLKENKVLSPAGETIASTWAGPATTVEISLAATPGAEGTRAFRVSFDRQDWGGTQLGMTKDGMWKEPVGAGWDALRFMFKGENSGVDIGIDIPDAGNEFHRYILTDDSDVWRVVEIPFSQFEHRQDWQPDNQDNNNIIDWPFNAFKFEPATNGVAVFYVDKVEVVKY